MPSPTSPPTSWEASPPRWAECDAPPPGEPSSSYFSQPRVFPTSGDVSESDSLHDTSSDERDAVFDVVRGARLLRQLDRHFRRASDSHTDRMLKIVTFLTQGVLLVIAIAVSVFFAAASGALVVAVVPSLGGAVVLFLACYNWYSKGIYAAPFAHVEVLALILCPAAMHMQLGGFEMSGHVVHFVLVGPALASVFFRSSSRTVGVYLALACGVTMLAVLFTEFGLVPEDSAFFAGARPISHTASLVSYLFSLLVPPLFMGLVLLFHTRSMELMKVARQTAVDSAAAAQHDAIQQREANAAKTRFVSVMSHEIRNPLTGIIICAEMLQRTALSSRQGFYCEGIDRASQVLLGIVNNVLDMTKIEAGSVSLERVRFNLLETTQLALQAVAPSAAVKDLELVLIAPPDLCYSVYGDPTRYRQILHNLVGNAIKFTVSGHVCVTLELQDPARKHSIQCVPLSESRDEDPASDSFGGSRSTATSWRESGTLPSDKSEGCEAAVQVWRVSVRDTGIGISAEGRRKLFKEFSQVDASTTREHGGTGLGLFICKQLVQLMGGSIQVNSAVGQGTEFAFTIEVEGTAGMHAASAQREPHPVAQLQSTEREWSVVVLCNTVLLTKAVEMYVKHFFQLVTCEILSLQGIGAAMRLLRARLSSTDESSVPQRTIVIVDSVVSTLELERVLLSASDDRAVPIMLSSAVSANAGRADLASAGWRHFLDKPVLPGPLCAVLSGICTSRPPSERSSLRSPRGCHTPCTTVPAKNESSSRVGVRTGAPSDDAPIVLVVDDMSMVRDLVRCLLEEDLGYRTLAAANGADAVKLLTSGEHSIALVLMDVEMPTMDGKEATERIREWETDQGRSAVPICAMSGNAMREDMHEALQCGMTMFLAKPVSREQLASVAAKYAPMLSSATEKPKRRAGGKSSGVKKRKAKRGAKEAS